MNKKNMLTITAALACLISIGTQAVRADDLDEKEQKLKNRINTAASSKQISGDDAGELRKQLGAFHEKKRQTKNSHDGTLSAEDDQMLDQQLNGVSQDFETRLAKKKK